MSAEGDWEADVISALAGLTEADMPAIEFLLLDQLASWIPEPSPKWLGRDQR